VERTLERATPGDKPGELAGWHRQMVPGHCYDMPRHRGEANFMLGVLANALEVYYADVPDPRVAEAVKGGARQAVKELWVPEADGFRYTSCPNMTGYTANNDMTAEVLFFAYRLGGNPEWGEIAMRAMAAAFRDGIGSIAHLRWTPRIIYNMDRALQPVFQEIMDAAYDPQVQEYVIKNGFDVTFDELQPLISPRIAQTIEQYQGKTYKGYDVEKQLKDEAALRIGSLVERNATLNEMIQELKNEPDTPLNRYLLQQYTNMPKMEPNLTRWDDWIDINNSMLPLLIAFVVILGVAITMTGI